MGHPLGAMLWASPPARTHAWHMGACGGGGCWHKASVSDCLPLAAPIGLSPLLILTLCGGGGGGSQRCGCSIPLIAYQPGPKREG